MTDRPTLHGHDTNCALCGLRVYGLWVAEEPPPFGCTDGLDDAPWTCSHVLGALQMAVMRLDYLDGTLLPHHQRIIGLIGEARAEEIFAHVRLHKSAPRAGKRREPDYSPPTVN